MAVWAYMRAFVALRIILVRGTFTCRSRVAHAIGSLVRFTIYNIGKYLQYDSLVLGLDLRDMVPWLPYWARAPVGWLCSVACCLSFGAAGLCGAISDLMDAFAFPVQVCVSSHSCPLYAVAYLLDNLGCCIGAQYGGLVC